MSYGYEIPTPTGGLIQTDQGTIVKIDTPTSTLLEMPNGETMTIIKPFSQR